MPRNPINSSGPGARAPSRPPRRPAGFPPAGRSPKGGALETRWSVANPDAHLVPDCKVSVGGKKLEGEQDARLTKVEVDLDVDLFGQCALVFNDPKLALINGPDFKAGAQVKVEIGHGSKLGKVFEGEVVALEPQFRRDLPPSLRVVCQESIHRLALKTATRALMEVDSKEIASKIAQEHGLTAQAPSGTKEHVLLGAGRRLGGEPMLLGDLAGDLLAVDLHQRPGGRLQRQPVDRFLADHAQGGRQVAAELRLQRDHLAFEDLAQLRAVADLDLDLRTRLEVRAVDQGELGIVEDQGALPEQVDVQVHLDLGEPSVLLAFQLLPADADLAVRDQVRVGVRHGPPRLQRSALRAPPGRRETRRPPRRPRRRPRSGT